MAELVGFLFFYCYDFLRNRLRIRISRKHILLFERLNKISQENIDFRYENYFRVGQKVPHFCYCDYFLSFRNFLRWDLLYRFFRYICQFNSVVSRSFNRTVYVRTLFSILLTVEINWEICKYSGSALDSKFIVRKAFIGNSNCKFSSCFDTSGRLLVYLSYSYIDNTLQAFICSDGS